MARKTREEGRRTEPREGSEAFAERGSELAQAFQSPLAPFVLLGLTQNGRWERWGGRLGRWTQTHLADLEIFLKAVGLEEVGEFEGAHVAVLGADFPLEIGDDGAQILEGVAGPQQFIPQAFPVEG